MTRTHHIQSWDVKVAFLRKFKLDGQHSKFSRAAQQQDELAVDIVICKKGERVFNCIPHSHISPRHHRFHLRSLIETCSDK
jgi:hypothetical protein